MGLTADQLRRGLDALAAIEPGFAAGLARHGYPEPRIRARGHATLLRTIIGQQVSVAAAAAIWGRMEALVAPVSIPSCSPRRPTRRCAPPASHARRHPM